MRRGKRANGLLHGSISTRLQRRMSSICSLPAVEHAETRRDEKRCETATAAAWRPPRNPRPQHGCEDGGREPKAGPLTSTSETATTHQHTLQAPGKRHGCRGPAREGTGIGACRHGRRQTALGHEAAANATGVEGTSDSRDAPCTRRLIVNKRKLRPRLKMCRREKNSEKKAAIVCLPLRAIEARLDRPMQHLPSEFRLKRC